VHSAAASLETVERALGDLRVNGGGGSNGPIPTHPNRGGRRGQPRGRITEVEQITVPATDFDFQGSNAKFEKASRSPAPAKDDNNNANGEASGETISSEGQEGEKDQHSSAYNKSTSFFDSLSSSADALAPGVDGGQSGGGRGRRGGGNMGRNRREEERERNVATFGEPGGVGLLGPGGYVGGWGGYGRRGGRPRRGGARGGPPAVPAQ
jgi:protein LSM14